MSLTRTRSGLYQPSLAMPDDQFTHVPFRMFAEAGGKEDWLTTSVNLLANPAVRAQEAATVSAMILIQDASATSPYFPGLDAAIANLGALSPAMPRVPGLRLLPGSITAWADMFDPNYWTIVADWVHRLSLHRVPGDPRMNFDAENYSGVGIGASVEPSVNAIAAVNASAGLNHTAAELRIAMKPLLSQIIADRINPIGMYPITNGSFGDAQLIPIFIAEAVGLSRVAFWWEGTTFEISELYRKNLCLGGSDAHVATQMAQQAEFDRTLRESYGIIGDAQHLSASDEDEGRAWGKLWAPGMSVPTVGDPASSLGRLRWWFDTTRFSPTCFQATWFSGLNISPLNGVDTAFYLRPLTTTSVGGDVPVSVGVQSLRGEIWAGTASTETTTASALVNASIVGLQIPAPVGGGFTWCALKYTNILPLLATDDWTHKLHDITVPSSGISADTPLWSLGQNNVQSAMLWWIEATAELRLYVKAAGVNQYTIATGLAKDVAHRVVIGRSGLTWRHSINGGVAVDRVAPAQAPLFRSVLYGMGCADQATMGNNAQVPGTGMIFTKDALTYVTQTIAGVSVPGFRSGAEFATMSDRTATSAHNYPFGWFT